MEEMKARSRLGTSLGEAKSSKQAAKEDEDDDDDDDEDIGPKIPDTNQSDQDEEEEDLIGPSINFNEKKSDVINIRRFVYFKKFH